MNLLFRMAIGGCCEALTRILGSCAEPTSRGFNSSSCTDPDGLVGGVWFGVVNARGCLVGWVGVEIVLSSWEGFFVFHVNAVLSAYRLGVWGQCVVTSFPSLAGSSRSMSAAPDSPPARPTAPSIPRHSDYSPPNFAVPRRTTTMSMRCCRGWLK